MTPRRITVAASEVLGMQGTGGAATADSLLAIALARQGHDVELVVAPGRRIDPLAAPWAGIYDGAGVRVTRLETRRSVRPGYLGPTFEVLEALRVSQPDVVVADDWRGLAWAGLRSRQLGRLLTETAFVLYCHGPARMLAEFARKVPDTLPRFGEEVAERAALELADAAVSPSAWLFDWEHERGWPAPPAPHVVPCLWRSVVLGEPPEQAPVGGPVRRLAFFGQLREGKGVRIFVESLGGLGDLAEGLEILFLGRETPRWTEDRVRAALDSRATARLASIRFEPALDPSAAMAELLRPGTLAVVPSLLDNSPYTVSECLEHGIPFLAARTGGIPELVAEEDRERMLFDPRTADLTRALRQVLTSVGGHAPASPGFDPQAALEAWLDLVSDVAPAHRRPATRASRVALLATGTDAARRARRLAEQTPADVEVVEAASRRAGLERASADWIVFLDDDDEPDDGLLDALLDAQAASDADAVTVGVRAAADPGAIQLFLGDPGALGIVENQYGVLALVRRTLVGPHEPDGGTDPEWSLLARLALAGARIVSIPEALSTHGGAPGTVADVPGEGLAVLEVFERHEGDRPRGLPQLAATLAAAHARQARARAAPAARPHPVRRLVTVLREDGPAGALRRVRARFARR